MAVAANNPLFKHFRQPALYLKLPSQGRFWPDAAIDLPVTGEIPVYPMTVKDEITLKTPDALMNGVGVIETIQSCCPNIKDAWKMPIIDLDAVLIAIRLASYGHNMDITTICKNCSSENDNTVDLRMVLDRLRIPEFQSERIDNLTFKFKPQAFEQNNKVGLIQYEQQRLIDAVTNSALTDEEKKAQFDEIFPKLTDLSVMTVVNNIESIMLEDGSQVVEEHYIKEFLFNCERSVYTEIKNKIDGIIKQLQIEPMEIACSECQATYQAELTFNQTSFFG
jgi:hypothetical protein